jgi:predicted RNase H-like HicB family nuclease/transcriptional regulator with XRE-family HTH domain
MVAEFPDCPGCVAVAGPSEDIGRNAAAVLRVWLESLLLSGGLPPLPSPRPAPRADARARAVDVPSLLALRIQTRHFRHLNGLTTGQLAASLGLQENQILKLEHPAGEPSPRAIERVTKALGLRSRERSLRPRALRPPQGDLFPSQQTGRLVRLAELSAYEVGADAEDPEVDVEVTLNLRSALLDEMQEAAGDNGASLGEWLVRAGKELLRREGLAASGVDERQEAFAFLGRSGTRG